MNRFVLWFINNYKGTDADTIKPNERCRVKLRLDKIYAILVDVKQVLEQMYYNTTRHSQTTPTHNTTQASTHNYKTHKKCILEISINNITNTKRETQTISTH